MHRGFTLIELVITVLVLGVLMAVAMPTLNAFNGESRAQQLAIDLSGFMQQAKSEAVMRNENLYAHFSFAHDQTPLIKDGSWTIALHKTDTAPTPITSGAISVLIGKPYRDVVVKHTYNPGNKILFDGIRGRVANNGSFEFYPDGLVSNKLAVSTATGNNRIRVCGKESAVYGYPQC